MEKRINLDSEVALLLINTKWNSAYTITNVLARMFYIIHMVEIRDELIKRKLIIIKDKNNGNSIFEVTPSGKDYLEKHLNDINSDAIIRYTKKPEFTALVFAGNDHTSE